MRIVTFVRFIYSFFQMEIHQEKFNRILLNYQSNAFNLFRNLFGKQFSMK